MRIQLTTLILSLLVGACAHHSETYSSEPLSNAANLPEPDVSLKIPGLSNCTSKDSDQLQLNSQQPVTVLVHGCFSSAGRFRALANVYAYQGQQTVCFNYDDRERLPVVARQFSKAVGKLSRALDTPEITVVAHSQGGLIARRAFTHSPSTEKNVDLVTISSPFGGIRAASHCGSKTLSWLSLGVTNLICTAVTGVKYNDIPANADFIKKPGALNTSVVKHFKIITDEENTCRVYNQHQRCVKDDFVFGVEEQKQKYVDAEEVMHELVVHAGHAEIVGNSSTVPDKLIGILQAEGYMRQTPVDKQQEFSDFLQKTYMGIAQQALY